MKHVYKLRIFTILNDIIIYIHRSSIGTFMVSFVNMYVHLAFNIVHEFSCIIVGVLAWP